MTEETELVEVPTDQVDEATNKLSEMFGTEDKVESKAKKTETEVRQARENSIRQLPATLQGALEGTNYSFDDLIVNPDSNDDGFKKEKVTIGELIAHRVAKKLAKGRLDRKSPYNSRKSELKLLISQRDHVDTLVDKLSELSKQYEENGDKPLNIRQQTLAGLRKIRKNPETQNVDTVVGDLKAKKEHVATPQEKASKALERLSGMEVFSGALEEGGQTVMDDRAEEAFRILADVIDNGPDIAGTIERANEEKAMALDKSLSDIEDDALEDMTDTDDVEEEAREIDALEENDEDNSEEEVFEQPEGLDLEDIMRTG